MSEMTTEAATSWLFKMAARTLINIAPERQEHLVGDIFGAEPWSFRRSGEPAIFAAVPEERAIYASSAGQASLWCLSYASFQIMAIATRTRRSLRPDEQPVIDLRPAFQTLMIDDYVAYSRSLFKVDKAWPSGLSMPAKDPGEGTEDWLVNNVYFGALAWILLHEVAHVHNADQKHVSPDLRIMQEYRADAFGTRWILDGAGRGLRREYRVLSVVIGLVWLFLNEAELGPSATHPAAILRFREAAEVFDLGERSLALECAAYVLRALLDPDSEPPLFDNSRESFGWVAGRLEALFGA